jgi:glucose-1-phosphate adenylyltransferase
MKKRILALVLAGGKGNRLGVLTRRMAKPAVLYGGKYRIIDFSLSNCINSGIDTVGVLTQYMPLKLNSHIGIGKPWDLDRMNGGLTILPPYLGKEAGQWYLGTANAVFQNMGFVDKYQPDNVIILSGDHVYKMDYSAMLRFHERNGADGTISVVNVPGDEAYRYGIIEADTNGRIHAFIEKPEKPRSTLASMGIYVFRWDTLKEYLARDDKNPDSEHDFGKNIIPAMLKGGAGLWAYRFSGYWRDVGTIRTYWESSMDLVKKEPGFNLYDPAWRIYTPNPVKPAHYIASSGKVKMSMIAEGCMIYGKVENSILSPGVFVDSGAVVKDSIVMSNTRVCEKCLIEKSILSERVKVGSGSRIGVGEPEPNRLEPDIYDWGITVVGQEARIPAGTDIGKNVMIDAGVCWEDFGAEQSDRGKVYLREESTNEITDGSNPDRLQEAGA